MISVAPSTTFLLDRVTLATGSTFSGSGLLNMNGTTTVTGNLTVTLPITQSGNLTGSGAVHLAAPMTWAGGDVSLSGGLEVLAGQTLTFPSNNTARTLTTSSLSNHGTVAMGGSNALNYQGGPVAVTNQSDGLWTLTGSDSIGLGGGAGPFSFTNAGTLQGFAARR